MLELLLELLWSKTISAPSFGRYWKQLIRSPYWSCCWFLFYMVDESDKNPIFYANFSKDLFIFDWSIMPSINHFWFFFRILVIIVTWVYKHVCKKINKIDSNIDMLFDKQPYPFSFKRQNDILFCLLVLKL